MRKGYLINFIMAKRQRVVTRSRQGAATTSSAPDRTRLWLALGAVVVVLLVGGLFYLGYRERTASTTTIEGATILPDAGRGHESGDLTYPVLVPASGTHNSEWLNCGIYEEPVRRENALHSMEHGAVWIAYQPELPAEQVDLLKSIVREERSNRGEALILLAPMPELETSVVATAWRVQLELEDASDARLREFVNRYQRGPFYPEPGASCSFGGIGEPGT
jgi:hypothetical protein